MRTHRYNTHALGTEIHKGPLRGNDENPRDSAPAPWVTRYTKGPHDRQRMCTQGTPWIAHPRTRVSKYTWGNHDKGKGCVSADTAPAPWVSKYTKGPRGKGCESQRFGTRSCGTRTRHEQPTAKGKDAYPQIQHPRLGYRNTPRAPDAKDANPNDSAPARVV